MPYVDGFPFVCFSGWFSANIKKLFTMATMQHSHLTAVWLELQITGLLAVRHSALITDRHAWDSMSVRSCHLMRAGCFFFSSYTKQRLPNAYAVYEPGHAKIRLWVKIWKIVIFVSTYTYTIVESLCKILLKSDNYKLYILHVSSCTLILFLTGQIRINPRRNQLAKWAASRCCRLWHAMVCCVAPYEIHDFLSCVSWQRIRSCSSNQSMTGWLSFLTFNNLLQCL